MTSLPGFTVEIDQNPYLPKAAGGSAELIIVDCSGSMDYPAHEAADEMALGTGTAKAVRVKKG